MVVQNTATVLAYLTYATWLMVPMVGCTTYFIADKQRGVAGAARTLTSDGLSRMSIVDLISSLLTLMIFLTLLCYLYCNSFALK